MNSLNEHPITPFTLGLSRLTDTVSGEIKSLLPMIVTIIQKKLPTTDAVYLLGAIMDDDTALYFLIITSDDEQRNSTSLNSMIEESCRSIANVKAFAHKARNVNTAVNGGNAFFNAILLHKNWYTFPAG